MKIKTSLFGDIDIDDSYRITFTSPILGFEEEKEFILIKNSNDLPFYWLQSIITPELAFFILDPFPFFPEYNPNLTNLNELKNIAIYVIVTIAEDFKLSTANLIAPIIIDLDKRSAMQIVLEGSYYTTRHKLFDICDPVAVG